MNCGIHTNVLINVLNVRHRACVREESHAKYDVRVDPLIKHELVAYIGVYLASTRAIAASSLIAIYFDLNASQFAWECRL